MLITLGLILLILIMVVGGDRGVVSLIALCGNLLILSLAIWLMASGVPVLLVTVCVGVVISCITLFYQNGSNRKTWSAFLATMITMLLLFFFIYIVVWRSEAGGLNEIQQVGEDVFYYNMNLNISMRNVAVSVILLSTLGRLRDPRPHRLVRLRRQFRYNGRLGTPAHAVSRLGRHDPWLGRRLWDFGRRCA